VQTTRTASGCVSCERNRSCTHWRGACGKALVAFYSKRKILIIIVAGTAVRNGPENNILSRVENYEQDHFYIVASGI
jgi:hypothetical protein